MYHYVPAAAAATAAHTLGYCYSGVHRAAM